MKEERWIEHYNNSDKILLVGEGDFSFSACLANAFGSSATNMLATSLDKKATVIEKHPTAEANLKTLKKHNCTILHEVDAHTMTTHSVLRTMKFDMVVFNFPHAGFREGMRECDEIHIKRHQNLVRGFFKSARKMLTRKGEIHVTHKTAHPFRNWEVEKLGEEEGLCLIEQVEFTKLAYPGYDNRKGDGWAPNDTFPVGKCTTFKFALPTFRHVLYDPCDATYFSQKQLRLEEEIQAVHWEIFKKLQL